MTLGYDRSNLVDTDFTTQLIREAVSHVSKWSLKLEIDWGIRNPLSKSRHFLTQTVPENTFFENRKTTAWKIIPVCRR
jgi:hypothetical protein